MSSVNFDPTSLNSGAAMLFITADQNQKNPPKRVLLFLVTRHSCLGDHAARAKTSSFAAVAVTFLLHYPSCSYPRDSSRSESCFGLRLPCCPLCYSLPCRNHDWPIIKRLLPSFLCDPVLNSLNAPSGPF